MLTPLVELLSTIETLTSEAERECPTDLCRTLALIESRAGVILQLGTLIKDANDITQSDLQRLLDIERASAVLLQRIQEKREQVREALRADMCGTARQRSFAECVAGVLDLRSSSQTFDL